DKKAKCIADIDDYLSKEWLYDETLDEMRNRKTFYATKILTTPSRNSFSIVIYKRENDSPVVMFSGLYCSVDCYISYKFDEKDVVTTRVLASNNTAVLMDEKAESFIKELINSEKFILELRTKDGTKQLKFNVAGLKPNHFIN
ncbi:TPA: hypothetical protein QB460_002105, partial [Pasteurella multocida]|nr:hypothetical protein [Pasteurella multocida]